MLNSKMQFGFIAILIFCGGWFLGQEIFNRKDSHVYTLYRNSIFDERARYHVGSFDAFEKADYNRENCDIAKELFGGQPNVKTRFWCERGIFASK